MTEKSFTHWLVKSTLITPFLIKNSIAFTNSVSEIASVAHHPAVFFTQFGTGSASAKGKPRKIIVKIEIVIM